VQLVCRFSQAIASADAAVTAGKATAGKLSFKHNLVSVDLTGVADAQTVTVTLTNIKNKNGEALASAAVTFRVLQGDVDASGERTSADVDVIKTRMAARRGKLTNGANFRSDVNRSGTLTQEDVALVQAAVDNNPQQPPNQQAANTPPTISQISSPQSAISGQPSTPIGFTIDDAESAPETLFVTATSSDQATVPDQNIAISGTGASRTITITPVAGITTVVPVIISLTVSDGIDTSAPMQYTLNVTPPPTTYLATLAPIAGVNSLGYGSATLTVAGDKKSAVLRYSYSNLSSADTDDAVYGPGDTTDDVYYDVPVGKAQGNQQPDGSFKWTFNPAKAAQYIAGIEAGNAYMLLETASFPAGELKGFFKKVTGSQTFTPPPDPPAIVIDPAKQKYDSSRFLQQAAFGGTSVEVASLTDASAQNNWLNAQFAMPGPIYPDYAGVAIAPVMGTLGPQSASQPYSDSSMYRHIYLRVVNAQAPNPYGDTLDDNRVHEAWWRNACGMQDQLRQRVATAYSEIFVVSENDANVDANIPGLASYYDMLANDAFGNYRQILKDVTLHPIMGIYLNMRGSVKVTLPAVPNENFGREILQLFSIGLYMLQPDGTLMLDANGQPIPTYDQGTITQFAQVFTGWNSDNRRINIPVLAQNATPPPAAVIQNFSSAYNRPMVITPSQHSNYQKNLLVYPGAPTWPGQSTPSMIPARGTHTAATSTAELDFALDNIFHHPNVGPYICKQLIQRLVGSNPSPPYVYRVAKVFADDGTGVRGNMKAVIKAILTDYEARSPDVLNEPGYGHCREPMIRMAQLLRSTGGFSKSGKWRIGKTDAVLQQTILRSPTVFNFFSPVYAEPGAVADAGIVSPELDIIYSTTVTQSQNMIYTGLYTVTYGTTPAGYSNTGFRGDSDGSDVYCDFNATGSGLIPLAQSKGSGAMIDEVGMLLIGAPLEPKMKRTVQTFILTKIGATDYLNQVKAAVHLISTSPQAAAQR
jgi:uncharacterized protein (DUF1800 family)